MLLQILHFLCFFHKFFWNSFLSYLAISNSVKVKTPTRNWRDHLRIDTRKLYQDISTGTAVFINQKRVNVCEHMTKMALLESLWKVPPGGCERDGWREIIWGYTTIYYIKSKRKIRTWTGIWTSDLQSLACRSNTWAILVQLTVQV